MGKIQFEITKKTIEKFVEEHLTDYYHWETLFMKYLKESRNQ